MKHNLVSFVIALLLVGGAMSIQASDATSLLLPKPRQLVENAGSFELNRTVSITDPTGSTLLASLFPNQGSSAAATVRVNLVDATALGTFDYTLPDFPNEGYKLYVLEGGGAEQDPR